MWICANSRCDISFSCSSTLIREASEIENVVNFAYEPKEKITLTFFLNRLEACINAIYLPPDEIQEHLMNPTDTMSTDEEKDFGNEAKSSRWLHSRKA